MSERPLETEYARPYAAYVSLVPEVDVLSVLENQVVEVRLRAAAVPAERETYRYAPGKWTIREVFGHVVDAERVFGYRAFCVSRGEQAPLPGFDEKEYVARSEFGWCSLAELVTEFATVRESSLAVLRRLDHAGWQRFGNANGTSISVRALAYIMAGHVRHHLGVLRARYNAPAAS